MALGSGGLHNEFLVALGKRMDDEEVRLMERLNMAYNRAEIPAWFNKV